MKLNVLILRKIKLLLISVLTLGFSTLGLAATKTSNVTTGNWNTPGSWTPSGVPAAGDNVVIANGHTITMNTTSPYTHNGSITVQSGGKLTLATDLIALGGLTVQGTATSPTRSAGILNQSGVRTLQIGENTGGGTPGMNISGTVSVSYLTLNKSSSTINTSGSVTVLQNFASENGGDLTINGTMAVLGNWSIATGNIDTEGGGIFSVDGCVTGNRNGLPDPNASPAMTFCAKGNRNNVNCNGAIPMEPSYIPYCNALYGSLPITLVSFNARFQSEDGRIRLEWMTGSEINNDFFTIERSNDARNFEKIQTVKGAGNSREKLTYETYDENPLPGTSYYRLKQTDLDGQFTYHKLTAVENTNEPAFGFSLVPNPNNGRDLNLSLQGKTDGQLQVAIYGRMGQMIQESLESVTDGSRMNVHLSQGLQDGIYWVKVRQGNEVVTRKMMVANR